MDDQLAQHDRAQLLELEREAWKKLNRLRFWAGGSYTPRASYELECGLYSNGRGAATVIGPEGPECKLTHNLDGAINLTHNLDGAINLMGRALAPGEFFAKPGSQRNDGAWPSSRQARLRKPSSEDGSGSARGSCLTYQTSSDS